MTFLHIKTGVLVSKQVVIAAAVVNAANALALNVDVWVTSGRDGKHLPESKHYTDQALDFRTKQILRDSDKQALAAMVRKRLGIEYDVILENVGEPNEHMHVEYDPT